MAGAVDFVGQQYLAKDRPLAQHEFVGLAVENIRTGHVGREQVRRELQPLILHAEDVGEGLRQRGFGDAGHSLQQHMPGGQEGNKQLDG